MFDDLILDLVEEEKQESKAPNAKLYSVYDLMCEADIEWHDRQVTEHYVHMAGE